MGFDYDGNERLGLTAIGRMVASTSSPFLMSCYFLERKERDTSLHTANGCD
jgi:hypothetical protein